MRAGLIAALLLVGGGTAHAQSAPSDSVRALEAAVVRGGADATDRPGLRRVPIAGVVARDPASVADVARLVPAAHVQTNSRGEALVYLRGAGERQVPVFFDGVPLTVAWDRRVDLSLLPSGIVGAVDVAVGADAAVGWGPNALGGVLDLQPHYGPPAGSLTEGEASGGLPAQGRFAALRLDAAARWRTTVALDAGVRAGDALPSGAALPFSQPGGALRLNTDARRVAVLLRGERGLTPATSASAFVLRLDVRKGVAPEGHLDPARSLVRYWRYPDVQMTGLGARVRHTGAVHADATAWALGFGQTLEQFGGPDYAARTATQTDRDGTLGARASLGRATRFGTVRAVAYGAASRHRQRNAEAGTATDDTFRHVDWSMGSEWGGRVGSRTRAVVAAGVDGFAPTETAGRRSSGAMHTWAARARIETEGPVRAWASAGRKGRFPSMRELYGEALGRFALNPTLGPETARLVDVGVAVDRPALTIEAGLFGRWTDGLIEQEVRPDGRRQRVNRSAGSAVGLDVAGALRVAPSLRLDGLWTAQRARVTAGGVSAERQETPASLGRLALTYLPLDGLTGALEALWTSSVLSLSEGGLDRLPGSLRLGVRAGWRLRTGAGWVEAFGRLDNATDAVHLPQTGLPAPGREIRLGLRGRL